MLFATTLDIISGKTEEAVNLVKKFKTPKGVTVKEFLGLFGKPDFLVVFEAPDEKTAVEFVLQFGRAMVHKTSLAFPAESL
ncbi:MAG: GYD domain-containing protein [bacterium]